jgi:hypothetical protein
MAHHPSFTSTDPSDRRWRAAVLWTLHDLRQSAARRRPLSLSNLCRLFELRWRSCGEASSPDPLAAGRRILATAHHSHR